MTSSGGSTPASVTPLGGGVIPASAFVFTVDGVEIGVFQEVNGLSLSIQTEEIPEGGQNAFVRKVPGRMTWPTMTFKRGLVQADNLFAWISKVSGDGFSSNSNKLTRCTGAVSVVNSSGNPVRSWNLVDVFPVKWSGPTFSSGAQSGLEESLEIAHHGFTSTTAS